MSDVFVKTVGVREAIDAIKLMLISDKKKKEFLSEAAKISRKTIQGRQKSQVDVLGSKLKPRKNKNNKKKMFQKLFLSKNFKINLQENEAILHFGRGQKVAEIHHYGKGISRDEFFKQKSKLSNIIKTDKATKGQADKLVAHGYRDAHTQKKLNRSQIMKRMKFNQAGFLLRVVYGQESSSKDVVWESRPLAAIDREAIAQLSNKILLNK